MPSITLDRFDGGLLLARPSSVAPANSLANLFNMDVQPGGWLRSRPNWRRTANPISIGSAIKGLYANGGMLWTFCLASSQAQVSGEVASINSAAGTAYVIEGTWANTQAPRLVVGWTYDGTLGNTGRLAGVTPWGTGFVVVMHDMTANQFYRALFEVNSAGFVTRTNLNTYAEMPNSGIMVTLKERIFALSDDGRTVRFCGVGAPTDWSTAGNAGFIDISRHFGSGRRAYGLGVYQGKLAVFTDQSIQLWEIDPDPTAFALENVVNGVGTRHHGSIVSLNGDLLFLSDSGIRSLTTLQNSLFPSDVDVGLPVNAIARSPDPVRDAPSGMVYSNVTAMAALPFGQYWCAAPEAWTFGGANERGWLAWSYSRQGKVNAWAWHGAGGSPRAKVQGWASLGTKVYLRTDKEPYLLVMTPDVFTLDQTETGAYANCAVTTQWLDFKSPGKRKTLTGIDMDAINVDSIGISTSVGGSRTGVLADTILIGSNQGGWTYSGEMIPTCVDGTEFRLSFVGGGWGETAINRITLHYELLAD